MATRSRPSTAAEPGRAVGAGPGGRDAAARGPSAIAIDVPLAQPYSIMIERGGLARLGAVVREVAPHSRAMLVVDANIAGTHGLAADRSLKGAGYAVTSVVLSADELTKRLETVRTLYEAMLAARLERESPVIALGGGIVGDIAGFAAATYLRGVPVVQAPTTLLAMVDAAIGGKTGVNLVLPTGGLGKNLIGAFWQPRAVLADPETLRSLPARDFGCGLAECVKHALIADAGLFRFIDANAAAILRLEPETLLELIGRSARIKVAIVAEDEREAGRRMLLNLGHTFAHALESLAELDIKHGEAVALGLVAAARCAAALQRCGAELPASIEALLAKLSLPTRILQPAALDALMLAMRYDKKVAGGGLRLILPVDLGRAEIASDVPEPVIRAAWASVGAAS